MTTGLLVYYRLRCAKCGEVFESILSTSPDELQNPDFIRIEEEHETGHFKAYIWQAYKDFLKKHIAIAEALPDA